MGKRLLALFLLLILGIPTFVFSNIGAEWNPTGNPIGGGPGYSDSIRHQDADYYVLTKSQLQSALVNASSGDVIYVADNAEIDLDGVDLIVPSGVTIASGRGRMLGDTISWGGLLYQDSVGYSQWEFLAFAAGGKARITGLRFRGAYSDLEGRSGADSFPQPVAASSAIAISRDSCEVDNCEFWGFGYCPIYVAAGEGNYVHHNYFHHGSHVYHGYGFNVSNTGKVVIEANYFDFHDCHITGGGDSIPASHYEARYNICGPHVAVQAFERHGSNYLASADWVRHNTVRCNGYVTGNVTGYWLRGRAVDSVFVNNNWFWDDDSASSIHLYSDSLCRVWDNHFTETAPPGVSSRLPVANIGVDVDSGSAPLTVTFSASESYDQDGGLRAFYWNFGDSSGSDNYARYANIDKVLQHTFHEIGIYHVELMVTDDDGISSFDYVDINVAPSNGRKYLSCWVKDKNHHRESGYYLQQILIDDWVAWEKDIAGDEGWQHVLIDVTDSITNLDSVGITYRLLCTRDSLTYPKPRIFIDDIVLYGGDVINGNFESGQWTGTCMRTEGNWIPSRCSDYYCWDWTAQVHSGIRCYSLNMSYANSIHAGDYAMVSQRVAVNETGIIPSIGGGTQVCSLYYPYPNPASVKTQFGYKLYDRNNVSLNIYDVTGRFVRSMVESTQLPGDYDVIWDGKDCSGKEVANGVYNFRFIAGDYAESKQIVWLR